MTRACCLGGAPEQSPPVTAAAPSVLTLDHVQRVLAGRVVVRELNLTMARGSVLGLLGVNGAGKSTTLRMMAGVLAPSSGRVLLGSEDLHEVPERARRRIGYLPETPPLHDELSAEEYLRFCARLRGLARGTVDAAVARAVERCGLGEIRRRPLGTLSKGFRQRVGLAQAILHEPELIVLDEPASGLDPVQALNLRELIGSLGREHAVVLSTHVLSDVLACCDRVAILHRGELRHLGTLEQAEGGSLRVGVTRVSTADDWLALPPVAAASAIDVTRWQVRLHAGVAVADFAALVVGRGFGLVELRPESSALESTFLAIAASDTVEAAA